MKTKELIKQLILRDPDGEAEVCVDNCEIFKIEGPMPCYYDGLFVQVVCDSKKRSHDNEEGVVEIKIKSKGNKIKLHTIDAEEALLSNPHAKFSLDEVNDKQDWENNIKKWRKQGIEFVEKFKKTC